MASRSSSSRRTSTLEPPGRSQGENRSAKHEGSQLSAGSAANGGAALSTDEPRYAWVVVWATFVALGVIFGVAYSFAAFFEPFTREFNAQRADVSLVFGLCGSG
jgi:hypothetical protein